jgi:cell fate regulator YaaT (PSP1 superfamily)
MTKTLIGIARGSNQRGTIKQNGEEINESGIEGRWCIFRNETGEDLARVSCFKECKNQNLRLLGDFVRFVNNDDLARIKRIKDYETSTKQACVGMIEKHGLKMKVIRTIQSFDEKKLTFYFVAEERVDFRELVKDLVSGFHKMIRLQQIGPRDHARMVNGVGICGRELCCAGFLGPVDKITKETAQAQGMNGLGSEKISGICGKLMCCLKYELEDYENKKRE